MSTSEEYLAKLGIDTSDVDSALDQLGTLLASLGDHFDELAPAMDRMQKNASKVGTSANEAASGIKQAKESTEEGSAAWRQYTKDLEEANQEYRKFRQGQVTGEGGGTSLGDTDDMDTLVATHKAMNANIITDEQLRAAQEKRIRDVAAANWIKTEEAKFAQEKRINDVAAAQWIANENKKTAAAQARAAQEKRINDVAAAQWMKSEQDKAAAASAKSSAIGGRNYSNTSVEVDSGIEQRRKEMAQYTASMKSRWEAEVKVQNEADKTAAATAKSSAAMDKSTTSSISARYALYDVSSALTVVSSGLIAVVAGTAGLAISFERDFADVKRTVGVTGEAAREMKADFAELSTQIPKSFAELTQIGALAGQLDIAQGNIVSFTKTVAQFSASSDMTIDASATALGRLDSLLDGVDGKYANLASSILNVGVNSVATESQIAGIASQIAAAASQAKLTTGEVVGLSGSLASLGVAPEAARGTILRVFGQLNSAVSQGGEKLNNFAAISGMTADEFKNSWGTEGGFTKTFLGFLEGVQNNAGGAESALRGLGIGAARDVNAMLKLAQNSDDVARNLRLAEAGFSDAGILSRNFGIISETTAAKLQMLGNSAMAFGAAIGDSTTGPLGFLVDGLNRFLQTATDLTSNPVVQWLSGFGIAITGIIAVLGLLVAGGTRAAASILAVRTAMGSAALSSAVAAGGMRGFGAAMIGAAGATGVFNAALKATGVGLIVTTGLWALSEAVTAIADSMKPASDRAKEYFGDLTSLTDAIAADNADLLAQSVNRQEEAITDAIVASDGWGDSLVNAAEANAQTKTAAEESATAINGIALAYGAASEAAVKNLLIENDKFQALMQNQELLDRLQTGERTQYGVTVPTPEFDIGKYLDVLTTEGQSAAQAFADAYKDRFREEIIEDDSLTADMKVAIIQSMEDDIGKFEEVGRVTGDAIQTGMKEAVGKRNTEGFLGKAVEQDAQSAEEYSAIIDSLINDIYGVGNAQIALANSMGSLGQEFVNNGAAAAFSGDTFQQVIAQIYNSSSGAGDAASRMMGFFNSLVEGGYASASQLSGLQAIIANLAGGRTVKPISMDLGAFTNGIGKARKALVGSSGGGGGSKPKGGLAKDVRTLVDYANDLRGVFSRAFQIRFAPSQGRDEITKTWADIRKATTEANADIADAIQDTNQSIRDHKAEISTLSSDKSLAQYWLRVAEAYGDTLRAAELRSEILDIDGKMKSSSEDLASTQKKNQEAVTEAQKKTNKTLVGNSEEAIANRAEILGLVGSYQDYIGELAASGMSQADLKAESQRLKGEFIAQATQLGYNRGELGKYATAFDDVALAISKVPRNVTVKADVNAGLQALGEFQAKLDKAANSKVDVKVNASRGGDSGAWDFLNGDSQTTLTAEVQVKIKSAWIYKDKIAAMRSIASALPGGMLIRDSELTNFLKQNGITGFQSGGYTGAGPADRVAGVVHAGEHVVTKANVDQSTGRPSVSWLQSQLALAGAAGVRAGARSGASSTASEVIAYLAPEDRRLLAQIRDNIGVTVSGPALTQVVGANISNDNRRGRG